MFRRIAILLTILLISVPVLAAANARVKTLDGATMQGQVGYTYSTSNTALINYMWYQFTGVPQTATSYCVHAVVYSQGRFVTQTARRCHTSIGSPISGYLFQGSTSNRPRVVVGQSEVVYYFSFSYVGWNNGRYGSFSRSTTVNVPIN